MSNSFRNPSEQIVFHLCKNSFLSLWSYANPRRTKGTRELCDVLVICDPHIIIFSVKNCSINNAKDPIVFVKRWYKKAITDSATQIYGAERNLCGASHVIRSDGSEGLLLPSLNNRIVHRVLVSFGSDGRIPITFGDYGKGFVHVFDETFLYIALQELDTITDFIGYLEAKERLVSQSEKVTVAGGQENLLAIYLSRGRSFSDLPPILRVGSNHWNEFTSTANYQRRIMADNISYLWDELLQHLCKYVLQGRMEFGRTLNENETVLRYMARENRFARRILSESYKEFIQLAKQKKVRARMMVSPSGLGYVFFNPPPEYDRDDRLAELGCRCFIARNEIAKCRTILGIGRNVERAPKGFCTDLILFSSQIWSEEQRQKAEEMKQSLGFFRTPLSRRMHADEYPPEKR